MHQFVVSKLERGNHEQKETVAAPVVLFAPAYVWTAIVEKFSLERETWGAHDLVPHATVNGRILH